MKWATQEKPCKSKERSTDEETKKLLVRSGVTKQERKHIDKREALKETEDQGDKNRKQRGTDSQGDHWKQRIAAAAAPEASKNESQREQK